MTGGKLAAGTRIVTEDDFIVNDSEEEYETASSDSGGGEECAASDPEDTTLENDWLSWGEGQNVDEKLREIVKSRGASGSFCPCASILPILSHGTFRTVYTFYSLRKYHWYSERS